MANVIVDLRGVVIELDHAETEDLLNGAPGTVDGAAGAVKKLLIAAGIAAPVLPIVAAAVAAYVLAESVVIRAVDKGFGVFLTSPPLAPGLVIPTTRWEPHLPGDWASRDKEILVSPGNDAVETRIERGVIEPGVAVFRLENRCPSGWNKAFILRDGTGGEWVVEAKGGQDAENGLYSDQLDRGQLFTFRKPAILGLWIDAFSIGGIGGVHGGDRVTFTWIAD